MTRWLSRQIERLPIGLVAKRALVETLSDSHYERRGPVMSIVRVLFAAIAEGLHVLPPFRHIGYDARAALRRLRSAPAFVVFSIAILTVVIGSTTAVYSVIDAAIYRQQPIPHLEEIVNIYQNDMRYGASGPLILLSPHDFDDLRSRQTSFSSVIAWTRGGGILNGAGAADQVLGEAVSGEYFSFFGVTPALGRMLQPADEEPGAARVLVLSDGLWRRLFGADPTVVGRVVGFAGQPFQIVGVAPAWFHGTDMPNITPTTIWMPLGSRGVDTMFGPNGAENYDRRQWFLKARLKPGVTLETARAEVAAISGAIALADPDRRSGNMTGRSRSAAGWFVLPMNQLRMHESVHVAAEPLAGALLIAVLLVALVGCSNLANLVFARAARRRQEIAVRTALGAPRGRVIQEQLVECSIIAAIGWIFGLVLARGLMVFFGQSIEMHAAYTITLQIQPILNGAAVLTSLIATGIAVVAIGLVPAIRATRASNLRAVIGDGGETGAPRWRLRGALVAGQVAVSVLLLVLSVVALRELRASLDHDPGFALDELAVMQVDMGTAGADARRALQISESARAAVAGIPGVRSAAVLSGLPIGQARSSAVSVSTPDQPLLTEGRGSATARFMSASGPFVETLGLSIAEGRSFSAAEFETGSAAAVISRSLASQLFDDRSAVGREIVMLKPSSAGTEKIATATRVVGVVEDTDTDTFGTGAYRHRLAVYSPLAQAPQSRLMIVARLAGPAKALGLMRSAMRAIDPDVAIVAADTGFAVAGPGVLMLEIVGGIAGSLGGFALVLAIAGLYGLLSDVVSRRTREIGIRVALGAERSAIHRMVIRDGLIPVFVGFAIGGGVAMAGSVVLPALIFVRMLPAASAGSLVTVGLPLIAAAVIACYLPARRASRVDPNVALREL